MADRAFPDQNNIHSLIVVSNADGITPVTLWADPTTHALVTSGSGGTGGGGTQYTQGGAIVANPTGNAQIYFDASGNPKAVGLTQPEPSSITDGTNTASVLAADTGFNGLIQANATKTIAFTTSVAGAQVLLANTDVRGYGTIEVVYTSVGAGLANTGQYSATSGGTYVSSSNFASGVSGFSGALGTTVNTVYTSPIRGNYFQINITALTSGTVTGTVTLRGNPPQSSGVQASQTGTWTVGANSATGSAVPANAFYQSGNVRTSSPTVATNGNLVGFTSDVVGEQLVAIGGLVTSAFAAGTAANTVIKAAAGRLCVIVVTTLGTAAVSIYDNATTNSGTVLIQIPASAAVGTIYQLNLPAASGITVAGVANSPGLTISWI